MELDKIYNPSTNEIFMFNTKDITKQNDWKCGGLKCIKTITKIIAAARTAIPDDYKGNIKESLK